MYVLFLNVKMYMLCLLGAFITFAPPHLCIYCCISISRKEIEYKTKNTSKLF